MKWRNFSLAVLALLSAPTWAKPQRESASTAAPAEVGYKVRSSYWSAGVGALIWQEFVQLNRGNSHAFMDSQFKGLVFHVDYNRPNPNSYWQGYYGLELAYGTLKGQGDQANIPDRLENQSWLSATFRPGFLVRTSPVSRFGVYIPAVYRKIQWNFNAGSGLTAADKKFSVGIGMLFALRLTKQSALNLNLIHQHQWETNLWSAGWNRDF